MTWQTRLEHRFVRHIPDQLQPGVLYVSMEYGTAVHSCCCGCGSEVVTPLAPTGWKLTFDGRAISLWPSIGNWNQPCRSHYVISGGLIRRAGPWSKEQVAAERQRDAAAKEGHYKEPTPAASTEPLWGASRNGGGGWWARLVRGLLR